MAEEQIKVETLGYRVYRKRLISEEYSDWTLPKIVEHRDSIFKKYSSSENKNVNCAVGMGYTEGIFAPVDYDGAFVDADSVFAAVYSLNIPFRCDKKWREKYIQWILFTNDEYMPVLSMVSIQKQSFFEWLFRIKKNDFIPEIEKACPNLKYPVCSAEQFEKIIGSSNTLKGKVSKDMAFEQLYDASHLKGIFDTDTISCEMGGLTKEIFTKNGYTVL